MELNEYVLLFLLTIIISLWSIYLKSYMRRKGENEATREDIKGLTVSVEKIRWEYHADLEKIKSHLSLISGQELNLATEQRNLIYAFNDKYYTWCNAALDLSRIGYEKEHMETFIINLIERKMSFTTALKRMEIFFQDDKFQSLTKRILVKTQELSDLNATCFMACHNLLHETRMNDIIEGTNNPFSDTYQVLAKRQSDQIDQFAKKQDGVYKELEPDLVALRDVLNEYILKVFRYPHDRDSQPIP